MTLVPVAAVLVGEVLHGSGWRNGGRRDLRERSDEAEDDHDHCDAHGTAAMSASRAERPRLLLVEDDSQLGPLMAKVLDEVYEVTLTPDGGEALDLARDRSWDVMIVDRRLPTVDGLTIVETLRGNGYSVPCSSLRRWARCRTRCAASTPGPTTTS
jgi:hypothetical protein